MARSDYQDAITKEVESWPGVSVSFEMGGKHPKAKFTFVPPGTDEPGVMLSRPFAGTPSDAVFGIHRMLGDMRRAMKQLGATRDKPEPSKEEDEAPYRKPNDGAAQRETLPERDPAPVKETVAEKLVGVGVATAEQVSAMDDSVRAELEAEASSMAAEELIRLASKIVDGIYFGLPENVYHKVARLSTSAMQEIAISPADFWKDSWLDPNPTVLTEEQEKRQNEARKVGAAYHVARLQPELFEGLYFRELDRADFPRKGTVYGGDDISAALAEMGETQKKKGEKVIDQARRLAEAGYDGLIWPLQVEEWESERRGRISLSAKVWDEIAQDMDRLRASGTIHDHLTGGAAEVSIFWTDENGLKMKCRVDYLRADSWADFKTFANPRGVAVKQALLDAFRFNRYHMQAVNYRDGVEKVRLGGLQIIGDANDAERALIAAIQMRPGELECRYIFQQKGGVPNLFSRRFKFFDVPIGTRLGHAGASEEGIAAAERGTRRPTQLHSRAKMDIEHAKKEFVLYSQVYAPGEPWRPIEDEEDFEDHDFNKHWLEGAA